MSLITMLFLTAIAGLGILVLLNWVAISEANGMERCRRILLMLLSIPCTSVTIWWVSHQLEDQRIDSYKNPNVKVRG